MSLEKNELLIEKEVLTYVENKNFYSAIVTLRNGYSRISSNCYNRTLCTLLFHFCLALGAQGHYITKATYDELMKLPLYRNISGRTPFMAATMQNRTNARLTLIERTLNL